METLTSAPPEKPTDTDNVVFDLRHPAVQHMREQHHEGLEIAREKILRDLLDPTTIREVKNPITGENEQVNFNFYGNYEDARSSGLLEAFEYDPETGEDAIIHILQGDIKYRHGVPEIAGYHHADSSRSSDTYVETEASEAGRLKREKTEKDFGEPYNEAKVHIYGFPKQVLRKDEDGNIKMEDVRSSMFPKGYDALTVLRSIVSARDQALRRYQDHPSEEVFKIGRDNTLVGVGYSAMLDEKTMMPIRLILNKDTGKIITAMPITRANGYMRLTPEEYRHHLMEPGNPKTQHSPVQVQIHRGRF